MSEKEKPQCRSVGCINEATHKIVWRDPNGLLFDVDLCLDHFNLWMLGPQVEVHSDMVSPWRRPEMAQDVLNDMVGRIELNLDDGIVGDANEGLLIAKEHVENVHVENDGFTLDTTALDAVEERVRKALEADNG